MKLSKFLLYKFNTQECKYYDEAVIESQIIMLEARLMKSDSEEEIERVYKEISEKHKQLSEIVKLRLVEFIIEKIK